MIKRVRPDIRPSPAESADWLHLDEQVQVELTCEDPDRPIEAALLPHLSHGWRAAMPGPQTIALVWPNPIRVTRVRLVCEEHSEAGRAGSSD